MFQEKERLEYFNEQAPAELKNRTWSSIQQENKRRAKQRRQGLVMAACFAFVLLAGDVMYQNSTILKVHDMPISYWNVRVEDANGEIPFSISEKKNESAPNEIPMEINVSGRAHVEVSEGYIRTQEDSEDSSKEIKELDIQEKTVIFWHVNGDSSTIAVCTITTEDSRYHYVMEKTESNCKIRLKEKE